jgi:predicted nucleic acid-binding protein
VSAVLVDSNVLLDIVTEDPRWFSWSAKALADAAETSRLVINPIIYAEISIRYSRIEDFDDALPRMLVDREALPYEAAFLAGKALLIYRQRSGNRRSPLPDFFIGAHASIAGYGLLTRDPARYRTYFPKLRLIAPGERLQKLKDT